MWLKLTSDEGKSIRINMARISAYSLHNDDIHTSLEYDEVMYLVKNTVEEIDDALLNVKSKLRLIPGW